MTTTVERVTTDNDYHITLTTNGDTVTLTPEEAQAVRDELNRIANELDDAAIEPPRCAWERYSSRRSPEPPDGCDAYTEPRSDYCGRHLADDTDDRGYDDAYGWPA
jgi:hypothetical protein